MAESNSTPRSTFDMATAAEEASASMHTGLRLICESFQSLHANDPQSVSRKIGEVFFLVEALQHHVLEIDRLRDDLYAIARAEKDPSPLLAAVG